MITTYLTAYIAVAVVFLVIDILWLGVIAKGFYLGQLKPLMLDQPKLLIAGIFYVLYVAGVVFFALKPAVEAESWHIAALYGAFLGVLCYGTYDLTNWATLKGWPPVMAVVDIIWGGVLTSVSATAGYFVTKMVTG